MAPPKSGLADGRAASPRRLPGPEIRNAARSLPAAARRRLASFPLYNPNPVLEVTLSGTVLFQNPAAVRMARELRAARGVCGFIPADLDKIARALAEGGGRYERREVRMGGRVFDETIHLTAGYGSLRIYAHDVTDRERAQQSLRGYRDSLARMVARRTAALRTAVGRLRGEVSRREESERRLRAGNSLLKLLGAAASLGEYLERVIDRLRRWSGCRCAGIRVLGEDGKIPYEAHRGFGRKFWESENWLSIRRDQCTCIRVITGKPEPHDLPAMTPGGSFRCDDLPKFSARLSNRQAATLRGRCARSGFHSLAVVPIRSRSGVVGAIHLADRRAGMVPPGRVEFIESLAPLIGEGIRKFNLEEEIEKDHATLEAFFAHAVSPLAFLDRHFNFIRVNRAYAEACARDESDFPGRNHFDLYPSDAKELFERVVETKAPLQVFERPFAFPDHPEWGVTYWDWTLVPILGKGGGVDYLIFALNDVTARKRAADELSAAQKKLEAARRLSDIGTLAATVAHELRNPLGVIQAAVYNVRKKAGAPQIEPHLARIEKKISESDQIINNLLFYSRIRTPRIERLQVLRPLREAIRAAAATHGARGVTVVARLAALRGAKIEADPFQLEEMFSNVLNNAYEAFPRKRGRIIITARKDEKGSIELRFSDNGAGIGPADLPRVFEPFYTNKARGTGLGLAVCKQIAELHGGTISVESRRGRGTTVAVRLPLRRGFSPRRRGGAVEEGQKKGESRPVHIPPAV